MEERNLGKSGLKVSLVGLGCNNFGGRLDLEATRAVVRAALDAGITLFDTADVYGNRGGSETQLGQVLGSERDTIVLASKFGIPMDDTGRSQGASRRYIVRAVEASLKRLQTDHLDLYQLHRPDPSTPIEETLRALDDLIRHGMVRYVGCSNLPGWQVADADWTAKTEHLNGFVSIQDEYSLLDRAAERDLLPAARAHGLGLLPYFPLASGLLSGKYRKGEPVPEGTRLSGRPIDPAQLDTVEALRGFAEARGHSLLELAFSWLAAQAPVASVIAGATKAEQVQQNVAAVNWTLTPDELAEVDRISAKA